MYISSECHSIDCITKCIRKSRKESIHKNTMTKNMINTSKLIKLL